MDGFHHPGDGKNDPSRGHRSVDASRTPPGRSGDIPPRSEADRSSPYKPDPRSRRGPGPLPSPGRDWRYTCIRSGSRPRPMTKGRPFSPSRIQAPGGRPIARAHDVARAEDDDRKAAPGVLVKQPALGQDFKTRIGDKIGGQTRFFLGYVRSAVAEGQSGRDENQPADGSAGRPAWPRQGSGPGRKCCSGRSPRRPRRRRSRRNGRRG